VNTASADELQRIIHIGPDRAQQIPGLRPFSSVRQLDRISGIGPARLDDILAQGVACAS
jgi:competence protein ComEC